MLLLLNIVKSFFLSEFLTTVVASVGGSGGSVNENEEEVEGVDAGEGARPTRLTFDEADMATGLQVEGECMDERKDGDGGELVFGIKGAGGGGAGEGEAQTQTRTVSLNSEALATLGRVNRQDLLMSGGSSSTSTSAIASGGQSSSVSGHDSFGYPSSSGQLRSQHSQSSSPIPLPPVSRTLDDDRSQSSKVGRVVDW